MYSILYSTLYDKHRLTHLKNPALFIFLFSISLLTFTHARGVSIPNSSAIALLNDQPGALLILLQERFEKLKATRNHMEIAMSKKIFGDLHKNLQEHKVAYEYYSEALTLLYRSHKIDYQKLYEIHRSVGCVLSCLRVY